MRRLVALRMLLFDRSSTAGSVLGVVAIVFLVGQQLAVFFGLQTFMSVLPDHAGADIWIVSKNTSNINTTGDLPLRYVDRIAGLPEVEWVDPLITTGGTFKNTDGTYQAVAIVGLPVPSLHGGPWAFSEGRLEDILDADGITVDSSDMDSLGYPRINQIYEINGVQVRIAAITKNIRGFQGNLVFTNIDKAREITRYASDRTSFIIVKLKAGISLDEGIAKIQALLPQAEVFSSTQLSANTRGYYTFSTGIGSSFFLTTFISVLVGIIIIMLTMYTNVLNRQKDFAVLRALGGRKHDIRVIVLFQALIIAFIGILIGFFLLAGFLFGVGNSRLPAYLPLELIAIHILLTILLCVLGSLVAMRRAVKIEPASAFR